MDTPSKKDQVAAKPLNTPVMTWFLDKVLADGGHAKDPRLNLVAADLKSLPPKTIINAEIDPLKSHCNMLADKMGSVSSEVARLNFLLRRSHT